MVEFLSKDAETAKQQIIAELYERLETCRIYANNVRVYTEFDSGVNCRATDELEWLESVIDLIERS